MGYYTQFNLKVVEGDCLLSDHEEEIGELSQYGPSLFDGEELKWYNHEEHMLVHSKKYPDILFSLEGKGEEQGDHWIKYFKDGKLQRCRAIISFEEYDPQKMK